MDWKLPYISKTITNIILRSILSAQSVSNWRFRQCINRL